MIPANLSLIPLSHERRAAMQAIAEVEKKYERGVHIAEFAYAHAFFRILNGSKRVTVKDIGWVFSGDDSTEPAGEKAGLAGSD
ncbi:PsiA protein [Salmonella enterica subsp. arizonae]|nr:PsiA protein [Salmonella enterica subsp. arizonae]